MWYPQIKGMPPPCLPLSGGLNAAEARTAILDPKVGTTHWGWEATRQNEPGSLTTQFYYCSPSLCMLRLSPKEKDTIFFNPLLFQCLLEAAELLSALMWNWWLRCYTKRHKIWKIYYIVSSGWVGGKDTDIAGHKVGATQCGTEKHLVKLPPATSQKAGLMPTEPMTPAEPVGKTQDGGVCWVTLPATWRATSNSHPLKWMQK